MPLTRLLSLALLLTLIGCSSQTFEVIATNKTEQPLTIGIVKDGPPYDQAMASPGEWAVGTRLDALPPWGNVLPPDRTIDSGKVSSRFPEGTRAYLRVYRGQHSNAELIGISEPSFDRTDVLLFPGKNEFIIENDPAKGLVAKRLHSNLGAR
jgi:hypothetical protein